ncbi:MAG: lipopolysaccharide kinase InaA family protein [Pseudazoarcus pumilus]|nr:lipopolysaccharide kinase InaA family protein [Pseudazoarcus pumilus]
MKPISQDTWQELRRDAVPVERDGHGEKVLLQPDGTYIKLFRRKRLLSSAAWSPYAQRFADNSEALQRRGIPCPQVIEIFRIGEIARDAVHYHPLPGQTLRNLLHKPMEAPDRGYLRVALNLFVRRLHDLGIYFRSLHLGNIVLTPGGELGLIDISDLRVHRRPLSMFWRKRNLNRMEGFPEEREWLDRAIILDPSHKPPTRRLK